MARQPTPVRRGLVYLVQFDPTVGHEIGKTRPAVVVSNDHMNALAPTVIVMPITSGQYSYYHWIPLTPPEGGLQKPSLIATEQLRTIDKRRLRRQLGRVSAATMARLEQAIRDHCALPESGMSG